MTSTAQTQVATRRPIGAHIVDRVIDPDVSSVSHPELATASPGAQAQVAPSVPDPSAARRRGRWIVVVASTLTVLVIVGVVVAIFGGAVFGSSAAGSCGGG